jgi:hypothetical protein
MARKLLTSQWQHGTPTAERLASLDFGPGTADLVLLCAFGPTLREKRSFEQLRARLLAAGFRAPAASHLIRTSRFLHRAGKSTYKMAR